MFDFQIYRTYVIKTGFFAVFLTILGPVVNPVFAADAAEIHVLGFSTDASHFAFEEFGISDGSGIAYSSLYVINTLEDRWVKPSPFRIQGQEEPSDSERDLAILRRQNHDNARDLLSSLSIQPNGFPLGHKLVSRQVTE